MSSNALIAVAIDGPSASGKSTVARQAARALGFNYVDSGSLYRGLTWKCLREGVDTEDPAAVTELVERTQLDFFVEEGVVRFTLDGEDPGAQIRSMPVQERVSDVAAVPEVRTRVVQHLRETARFGSLVMEGRDIGTVVFPDTPHKFYLDADPEERARRRHQEFVQSANDTTVDNVLASLQRRDRKDSTRKTAPLQIALGARVIDSTAMQADEVVGLVVERVRNASATA
ncbi:MAG TPA: (d)CMP kinase [Kiritimatiellia bacterium]|nr:(d)CMP kinase [Kiritimatiellia bacterium]